MSTAETELEAKPAPLLLAELSGVARVEAAEEVLLVVFDNEVVLVDVVPGTVEAGGNGVLCTMSVVATVPFVPCAF